MVVMVLNINVVDESPLNIYGHENLSQNMCIFSKKICITSFTTLELEWVGTEICETDHMFGDEIPLQW